MEDFVSRAISWNLLLALHSCGWSSHSRGGVRLSISVNRKKVCELCEPTQKSYVNRCEPVWKFMRTGVNRKHTLVSVSLKNMRTVWTDTKKLCEPVRTGVKIYTNRCEPKTYGCELPLKNMWTSVNRKKMMCEPVWIGAGNYVNRCEPRFALTESLGGDIADHNIP